MTDATHQCLCVLSHEKQTNRCPQPAWMDAPFCADCEARHPDMLPWVTVSAVMPV
jgi:hypothetical protein